MTSGSDQKKADNPLLEIRRLHVAFYLRQGIAKALDDLNLTINRGETLGLVGESGCGKSVTSLAIMQLIPEPGKINGGEVLLHGEDLIKKSKKEMRQIRANKISMIFQDPTSALNPVLSIGDQLTDTMIIHRKMSKKAALEKAEFHLREVGISNPRRQLSQYPHELSGGMKQRVMIAMALSSEPDLLIADEPTTALDVTIQAQILELMLELQQKYNTAILMITHDLGVIAEITDRVAVMYAGKIVEQTDVKTLFKQPLHPYTNGLMKAIPSAVEDLSQEEMLYTIPGNVPTLLELPRGCYFQDRCHLMDDKCQSQQPEILDKGQGHMVRCFQV